MGKTVAPENDARRRRGLRWEASSATDEQHAEHVAWTTIERAERNTSTASSMNTGAWLFRQWIRRRDYHV